MNPASVFFSTYHLKLRKKYSKDSETLSNFNGNQDFFSLVTSKLTSLVNQSVTDAKTQQVCRIKTINSDPTERLIWGTVERGEYGQESKVIDAATSAETVFEKTKALLIPSYFMFSLPSTDTGILLFSKFKNVSGRQFMMDQLHASLGQHNENFKLQISQLMPLDQIRQLLESGVVKRLKFIKFSVSSDIADVFQASGANEVEGEEIVSLTIKSSSASTNIARKICGLLPSADTFNVKQLYAIPDFQYDDVRVEILINGKPKTIDLGQIVKVRSNFDVSNEAEIGSDGYPTSDSLHASGKTLLADLIAAMGS